MILSFMLLCCGGMAYAVAPPDSIPPSKHQEYQIHLQQPAKSIRLLLDDRSMLPVRGRISEDGKSVILPDYEKGQKIRLKVEYEVGSVEELIKSPCYIDPVVRSQPVPRRDRILRLV